MTAEYINLGGEASLKLTGDYDPLKHLALINPLEQRALGLRFAIESTARHFDFTTDAIKGTQSDQMYAMTDLLIQRAKMFTSYIAGEE